MEQHTYRYLKGLVNSDYQIVQGEPNIIGWEVKNESNAYIGEVVDLLYDPETLAVRYMIIDLENNGMNLGDKNVMIPIGIAHLHINDDEVVLPNVHIDQFNALPAYRNGNIGPDTEVYIRSVIGSPAALRMEEEMAHFDQEKFYTHLHFDKESFYRRGGNPDRKTYENSYRPGEHEIKHWLQPGASHNQGGDKQDSNTDAPNTNPSPYQP